MTDEEKQKMIEELMYFFRTNNFKKLKEISEDESVPDEKRLAALLVLQQPKYSRKGESEW